jgi:hypothetical protein
MGTRRRADWAGGGGGEGGCVPGAGEFVELAARGEDDERDLGVAEDGELEGLLEQAVAALGEGDLAARGVLYPLHLRLPPHHLRSPMNQPTTRAAAAKNGKEWWWRRCRVWP